MKSSVTKLFIKGFVSLSVGLIIFLVSLLFNETLEAHINNSFRGFIYGISVGLMMAGTVFIIIYLIKTRHPLSRKRFETALNDERTQQLYQKSALIAMRSLPIIGALFIIVAYAVNQRTVAIILMLFEYVIICVFLGSTLFLKNRM